MRKRQIKKLLDAKMKKFDLDNTSLLAISWDDSSFDAIKMLSMSIKAYDVLVVPEDFEISSIDEKSMNKLGWIRKLANN